MKKELSEKQIAALQKAVPKKPIKYELGGGYYYKCFWAACDGDINKWFNYCPYCGQKIDWSDE